MQLAQRVLVIVTMMVVLICGIAVVCREKENKMQNQWEELQTERFLKKLCENGCISLEEYMQFSELLNITGTAVEIQIEEYRKEMDLEGTCYYYLVSWEERKEELEQTGVCLFKPESVVCIHIGRQEIKSDYYGMVSGKE